MSKTYSEWRRPVANPPKTNRPASEPESERTVVITRRYQAPARLLFEAWSKPAHLMKWFGPVGWPLTLCEVDFRVGGRFRFAMTAPDGQQNTPFGGTYLEIVPDRRIQFDNGFLVPGAERMVMTVSFEESRDASGKVMTLMTHHTLFGSIAMYRTHTKMGFEAGTNSALDQLADVVAAMA